MIARLLTVSLSCLLVLGCAKTPKIEDASSSEIPLPAITSDAALERLKSGNLRYTSGDTIWTGVASEELNQHTTGQNPYAIVISCADSRVPVEHVFDAGVGELFVLRVAGNVATDEIIGSAEYAIAALNTPLLVVMGHSSCGAVAGALTVKDGAYPDDLQNLLEHISGGLEEEGAKAAEIDAAVHANVKRQVASILEVSTVSSAVEEGDLIVVGAVYDIGTGAVTFIDG